MSLAYAAAEAPAQRVLRELACDPGALAGVLLLLMLIVLAIVGPAVASQSPSDATQLGAIHANLPPGTRDASGHAHWLGTDGRGRDIASLVPYGLRVSLLVGVTATIGALAVGSLIGLVAAFGVGRLGGLVMRIVDLQLSIPTLLIALMLVFALGHRATSVIVALILAQWPSFAKDVHRAAVAGSGKCHVEAARGLALSRSRILFRHVLPSCVPPMLVLVLLQMACAMALEATLTFIGLGLRGTDLSLGGLVANGYHDILAGRYWISLFPGVVLFLTFLAVNLVAQQVDDHLDPRRQ